MNSLNFYKEEESYYFMNIKTKKQNEDGIVRLESSGEIKEILINEDFLHPDAASVAICFRGKSSSGILEMSPKEIEKLYSIVGKKLHLIKGIKIIQG